MYEVRPLICREFEMGEPDCVDERDKWFIKLDLAKASQDKGGQALAGS
ncbi:hypothetical protein ACK348_01760 [Aeromonas veronii]